MKGFPFHCPFDSSLSRKVSLCHEPLTLQVSLPFYLCVCIYIYICKCPCKFLYTLMHTSEVGDRTSRISASSSSHVRSREITGSGCKGSWRLGCTGFRVSGSGACRIISITVTGSRLAVRVW